MQADLWGLHFALYSNPNYPVYHKIGETTFGMQITMPSDVIAVPYLVKTAIEAYVGVNILWTGLLPDLKIVYSNFDGLDHLIISPRALQLINARAAYETARKIKENNDMEVLALANGSSVLKNTYKSYLTYELSVVPGIRLQTLNAPSTNSQTITFPIYNPLDGTWRCP
jgi:hypothetical protein